jgi:hypothetical protein
MDQSLETEAEIIAEIERLELQARDVRNRRDHARSDVDRRVLDRQLDELEDQVDRLRAQLR